MSDSSSQSRQATPGPSETHGISVTSRKRQSPDDLSDVDYPSLKKLKSHQPESSSTKKDKKKRRKKKKKVSVATTVAPFPKRTVISRAITASLLRASPPSADVIEGIMSQPPPEAFVKTPEPAQVISAAEPGTDTSAGVIEKLNAELTTKSTLIRAQENAMSQVQQNLTCQICLDLLYKPFALSPCGHVACYSCLMAWFSRPTEEGAGLDQPPIWLRRKTCPHCRAFVHEPPVEVWAIKNMVASLVGTGLLVGIPPPPELESENASETANKDELWKNIFCPYRPRRHIASREDIGILDEEDGGIYRCIDCMHEIANGVCTECGRIYASHAGDDFSDSGEDDFGMMYDLYGIDEDDLVEFEGGWHTHHTHAHVARLFEDASEDEEEDDYFIDDGALFPYSDEPDLRALFDLQVPEEDDVDPGLEHVRVPTRAPEVIEVTDDEDDQPPIRTRIPRRGGRNRAQRAIHIVSEDEDEVVDNAPSNTPRSLLASRRHDANVLLSDDENEEDGSGDEDIHLEYFEGDSEVEEEGFHHAHEDFFIHDGSDMDNDHFVDDYDEDDAPDYF